MKQRKECLGTQSDSLSIVIRRYFSAGFSALLQTSTTISLIIKRRNSAFITGSILIALLFLSLFLFTGATNLFGLNGSAYAEYTISMTSSGAQSIDILPDASNVNTSISIDAVTVTTTCPAGYNLTTTTSVNDNKLYLNGSSSNNATDTYFNPSDGTTALSNAPNTWGFYQDGSTVPTASSVFKPVPISTSTPATIRTSSSTSDSFNIYYGVAASSSLAPGTYKMIPDQNKSNENGTIVYYLTMAEECMRQYMQEVTDSQLAELMPNDGDSATLYDKRDDSDYQITKINGNYWMTQNLRITGTIPSEGSNFNNVSSWKVDQGDLDSTITPSGYASYTEPRIHSGVDSEGNPTMWYNICAASANNSGGCSSSVPYYADVGEVTGDICPYGWRLPTKDEFEGIKNYASSFNIVKGGNYYNGAVNSTTTAYWWSATNAYAETGYGYRQYYLAANASNALSTTQNNTRRGEYIRCIKHPSYTKVTVNFAGNGISKVTLANSTYGNQTVSSSGSTATIKTGASYILTATLESGATFTNWLASDGLLGSTTTNPTTYATSGAAIITATADSPCRPTGTTIDTIGCMQDISANNKTAVLNSMTEGTQYKLIDSRDSKEYYVAKLPDGNIWMTQNLDLDLSTSTTLTPANTDIPTNWTPNRSTKATSNKTWIWTFTTPESYDPGNKCWNGNLNTSWNGTLDNMTKACTNYHYHIGNFYNWTAAVAMNDSSSYSSSTQDANQSICPAGWRLPTRDGLSKSYYNLINGRYTATTSGNIQKSPVYFTYGGRWGGESFGQYVGSLGEYYSSAVLDTDSSGYQAVMLYFDVDQTGGPGWGAYRDVGFAVRCVAR